MADPLEVTLRKASRGGGPRKYHSATRPAHLPRERFVIIVHGFNRTEDEARESYVSFQDNLIGVANRVGRDLCAVFWTGDSWTPFLRVLKYPSLIDNAIACAAPLAEFIAGCHRRAGGPSEIIVVAHSLGCRLVLEALLSLKDRKPTPQLNLTVVLMAAAVPTQYLGSTGYLKNSVRVARRIYVMFSPVDKTLARLFAPGQRFARDPPSGKIEAVGLNGQPLTLWNKPILMDGFDHGDYWTESRTAEEVAKLAGVPVATALDSRTLVRRLGVPPRRLSRRRLRGVRSLQRRRV